MKLFLFFLFSLLFSQYVSAQSQTKEYYDKKGNLTSADECYYYRLNKSRYWDGDTVRTFYCSTNTLRSVEPVAEYGGTEGICVFFHENAAICSKGRFEKSQPVEYFESWYPDGKKQSIEYFDPEPLGKSVIINYWDSLGNQIIKDGTGFCECVSRIYAGNTLLEKGKLREGIRDSIWTGFREGRLYFEEKYLNGELKKGVSYDENGFSYEYSAIEEMASPVNGMTSAYQHVSKTLRYPKLARRQGIEGKVVVEYIVGKDGVLTDIKVVKGIGGGCDEEALKAVSSLPGWNPGKQRGQCVRQRMVLPIAFKLG
jgi:TonB family protein